MDMYIVSALPGTDHSLVKWCDFAPSGSPGLPRIMENLENLENGEKYPMHGKIMEYENFIKIMEKSLNLNFFVNNLWKIHGI